MNVFSKLFNGGGNAPTVPAAAPQNQQQAPAETPAETPSAEGNANLQSTTSVMDKFANLWEQPKADGTEKPATRQVSEQDIAKAISGMDFTKTVDPALMQQIAAGGEDAVKATLQAINAANKNSFQQSMVVMSKMMEQMRSEIEHKAAQTASGVYNRQAVEQNLFGGEKASVLSSPAIKPLVQATAAQIKKQNPNMSPQEVAAATEQLLQEFGQQFAGNKSSQQKPEVDASQDWGAFFGD